MNGSKRFHGFQLNNEFTIYQKINAQAVVKPHPVVIEANRFLSFHPQPAPFQRPCENRLIYGFKQSRPQFLVDVKSRIHDNDRYFFHIHFVLRALRDFVVCVSVTPPAVVIPRPRLL